MRSQVQWQNLTLYGNGVKMKLFLDVTIQTKPTLLQAEKGLKFAGRASGLESEKSVWGSRLGVKSSGQKHKLDGNLQEQELICKAAREREKRGPPLHPSSAFLPQASCWWDRPCKSPWPMSHWLTWSDGTLSVRILLWRGDVPAGSCRCYFEPGEHLQNSFLETCMKGIWHYVRLHAHPPLLLFKEKF